jgi:hypothetical protein
MNEPAVLEGTVVAPSESADLALKDDDPNGGPPSQTGRPPN